MSSIPTLSRLIIIFCLSVICSQYTQAQTAAKWYFGIDIGLDFSTAPPTLLNTTSPVAEYDNSSLGGYNVESSSVAYDASGNMVFVAIPSGAGAYGVYDKNFANIGSVATTSDAAQGSLIFPVPGSTTTYFLCTVDAMTGICGSGDVGSDRGANYYLVTNTGSTVTVGAANNLVASGVAECQVGVVNNTATGYWWIIHVRGSNEFRVYKVSAGGITYDHSDLVGYAFGACDYVSQLAVNDCNNQIAMTIAGQVSLFSFNNTTGAIGATLSQQWALACAYGLEFSTNNNYLFVSTGTQGGCTGQVNQYDITSGVAATINSSVSNLGSTFGALGKSGHLQLGPDGNIYVAQMSANGGSSYPHHIGQITNINTKPATFSSTAITISDPINGKMAVSMGLPTILKASITGQAVLQLPNANSICVGSNSTFGYTFSGVAVSQTWTLTPSTGFTYVASTNTSVSPTINFTTAGPYSIQVTVTDNCGNSYTDVTSITVNPQVNSTGTITCSPLTGNVTAPNGSYTYVWYADAALTQPIAKGSTSVSLPNAGTGTYYVAAENSASSANSTNTLLSSSTGDGTYDHAAGQNYTTITVAKTTVINSFQWYPSGINYGTNPTNKTYTVSITDVSGSNVYWTSTAVVNVYNALPMQTASPGVTLSPGTYRIKIVGTGNPNNWTCGCTPLVAGDNAVTVTAAGDNVIGNLNYTATTYTVTALACSNAGAIPFSCPLPVSLVDFTARRTGEVASVSVEWSTASEQNSKVFYIQRSIDGVTFETVGQIDAAGNSTSYKPYSYNDVTAPVGNIYYRLFEVDFDGSPTYSKIVYVNGINSLNLTLVPNPGNGSFTITGLTGDTKLNVSIYAITGQSLFTTTTHPGEVIDLGDLAKGFYIVKIGAGNTEQSIRYINQ